MEEDIQEAIEEFKKLLKLRKNKAGEITHDSCIISTAQLETVLTYIETLEKELEELLNKGGE